MRPYVPSDYPEVSGWYADRGLAAPPAWSLPMTGLIEPGVAAGFMWRTDSGVALFDGWISNPGAKRIAAARVLVAVCRGLVERAQAEGFRSVLTWTRVRGVERAAHRNAFKSVGGFTMMARAIDPGELAHNQINEA